MSDNKKTPDTAEQERAKLEQEVWYTKNPEYDGRLNRDGSFRKGTDGTAAKAPVQTQTRAPVSTKPKGPGM